MRSTTGGRDAGEAKWVCGQVAEEHIADYSGREVLGHVMVSWVRLVRVKKVVVVQAVLPTGVLDDISVVWGLKLDAELNTRPSV